MRSEKSHSNFKIYKTKTRTCMVIHHRSTLKAPETKSDTVDIRPSFASTEPTIPKRHEVK